MKTAEQIAEKWAESVGATCEYHDQHLIQALHEYGEIVRQRAAGMSREQAVGDLAKQVCAKVAAAIERMELP